MSESVELDSASFPTQVVLTGVLELARDGETPAHAGEIRATCNEALEAVESDALGTVTEAEVSRTLNELEADGLVDGSRDETSATGKGRPKYVLGVQAEAIRGALESDDRVAPLIDRLE